MAKKKDEWTPISVRKMYGDREFSNTPGLAPHIPVFDTKAVSELSCTILKMKSKFCHFILRMVLFTLLM